MNLAALSAESVNKTPPLARGWFAIIPTTLPSILASPVINSVANNFLISQKLSLSITRLISSIISNAAFWFSGMISFSDFSKLLISDDSILFGVFLKFAGKYLKYFCAKEIASSSLLTKTSPQPETEQCILAPPISSKETFSPITFSAIRGEPKYIEALPSTITTISQNAGKIGRASCRESEEKQ